MIDIDHFKSVNDSWGHNTGDLILSGVATLIRSCLREGDLAFRYGGEELTILLRGYNATAARVLAERIRIKIENHSFKSDRGNKVPLTISLGIAEYESAI